MNHRSPFHQLSAVLLATVVALSMATAIARADEVVAVVAEEADDPNTGAVSLTFDNSFTTAYMFRGVMNERDGLIWQPTLGLSINLFEAEEGVVRSVDLGLPIWLSVHSEDTGSDGSGPDAIYEADYYPSLSVSWAGGVTSALTYYFYTSPNGAFRTVEEVAIDLSYDDSELLGAFAMNPTATFAFETHRSSFGGIGKGSVFEFGLEPGLEVKLPMEAADEYPIAITFPFKFALSMDDYYREGSDNDTFGYARLGLHAGIPIACIPPRFGDWSITNGFDLYFLGDNVHKYAKHNFGMSDSVYPVWTSSITLEY